MIFSINISHWKKSMCNSNTSEYRSGSRYLWCVNFHIMGTGSRHINTLSFQKNSKLIRFSSKHINCELNFFFEIINLFVKSCALSLLSYYIHSMDNRTHASFGILFLYFSLNHKIFISLANKTLKHNKKSHRIPFKF